MDYIKDKKDLNGKIVLLRLDLNVPIKNGKITDETRINKILPIFKHLIEQRSKIIVISHIGRPKGKKDEDLSLKPICKCLEIKLQKKIELIEGKKVPLSLMLDTNSPLLERKIKSPTKPELSEFVPKFTTVPASI